MNARDRLHRKGKQYYSYILFYLDDLLMIHHNPKLIMDKINSFLPLKPGSVGPPEMYLGAKLRKKTFEDYTMAWGLSPAKYVQQAVRNVETYLKTNLEGRYRKGGRTHFTPLWSQRWSPITCSSLAS
eukprot:CCRYP_000236-RA/>CCRYP_000236-RA protein AED:0.43 eAED:0.43 QI:0/0/0/1/0/0/2/0/126